MKREAINIFLDLNLLLINKLFSRCNLFIRIILPLYPQNNLVKLLLWLNQRAQGLLAIHW